MTDLFDQSNQEQTNTNVAPVNNNLFEDKLKAIVNEQGQPKYKDVGTALEALTASQAHIKRLEDEAKAKQALLDNAVAEKARADALEEIVNRMSNNSGNQPKVETPTNVAPSEEAIVKQLEGIIARKEAQTNAQKNVEAVTSALVSKFGDESKTKEAVAAKARELGMTTQKLGALSSENPLAVLALFGVNSKPNVAPTSPSSTPLVVPKPGSKVQLPEKSLLSGIGATDANRKAVWLQIKEDMKEEARQNGYEIK